MAAEAGADALGLNFYPGSTRYVDELQAREVADAIPTEVARVGVFVNQPPEFLREMQRRYRLDYLQLHGDEPVAELRELRGLRLIRALRCRDGQVESVLEYLAECERQEVELSGILLDAYEPGSYGGTGRRLDWAEVRRIRPRLSATPLILAGGLRPENVGRAIRTARPDAVDTASGVEQSPGRKAAEKVAAFITAAREAWQTLRSQAG